MPEEPSDTPDAATPPPAASRSRSRFWWVRPTMFVVFAIILSIEGYIVWPELAKAGQSLSEADWVWIAAAIVAAALSMDSFAQVQRRLLSSAGLKVKQLDSAAVMYAANAMSVSLPGGPVLSATFTYRQQRRWGATPVIATWQLVMAGVLQGVGLALLGIGGAFLLGAKNNPFSLIFTLGGFLALLVLAQYIASHPDMLEAIGIRVLGWLNSVRSKPADYGVSRWREILTQFEAVKLGRRDTAVAFAWSIFNWFADVACLGFACWAVGEQPSYAGLAVAYAAGKAAGTVFPLVPGGLGVVEFVLGPALVSAGMSGAGAISAILVYRFISFFLVAVVGWVIFLFAFRHHANVDPDEA